METETIFGFLATATGITVASVGLPIQLLKNYKRKSVEGLSLVFWVLAYINGWCWFTYAIVKMQPDIYLIIANIPGLTFMTILLTQFVVYSKNKTIKTFNKD